jgi:hypothetical protein
MGRSILHRKSTQNRRRDLDPTADHLMAATHYNSDAYDDYIELRDNPPVPEPVVSLKQSELASLLARIASLEQARDTVEEPIDLHASSDSQAG